MESLSYLSSRKKQLTGLVMAGIVLLLAGGIAYGNHGIFEQTTDWLEYVWFALGVFGAITLARNVKRSTSVALGSTGLKARALGNAIVKWSYIQRFEAADGADGAVMIVQTRNREKLLGEMNAGVRPLMKANIKSYGEPVVIPATEFDVPLAEAVAAMEALRKRRK